MNDITFSLKFDIKAALKKISELSKSVKEGLFGKASLNIDTSRANEALRQTGELANKAFAFNQIYQGITQVTQALDQFITPYVEFDKQLKNIGTLGVKNFEEFRNSAIDLASSVPDTVAGVTEGIYNAISAGAIEVVDGQANVAEGMKFVEQASKLAVAGLTDTNSAIKSLSSVTNAYGPAILAPANAADILFATVKNGVTTISELNASMSNVVPIAAAAGVEFDQVGAAIATMTKQGTPTAEATTKIRSAIAELMKPGANLKKVMDEAGVSMASLKQDGLQVTMAKLGEAMKSMGTDSANTFSSIESIQFALSVTGDNAQKAAMDLEAIREGAGSVEQAFNIANEGIGVKIQGILNQVEAYAFKAFGTIGDSATVAIGAINKLAPTITAFAGLSNIIPPGAVQAAKNYGAMLASSLVPGLVSQDIATKKLIINTNALTFSNIRQSVASKAQTALLFAKTAAMKLATVATAAFNAVMSANPVALVIIGVTALVASLILLYRNVEPVRIAMDKFWEGLKAVAQGVWDTTKIIISGIVGYYKAIWEVVAGLATSLFKLFTGDFSGAVESFTSIGKKVGEAFVGSVEETVDDIKFDKFKEGMQDAVKDGVEITAKMNEAESYDKMLEGYNNVTQRINELETAKMKVGLDADDEKELEKLTQEAGKFKVEIAKVSPEVKANIRYAVDENGKLIETYDINITKAEELAQKNKDALNIGTASKEFSDNLRGSLTLLDGQKKKLEGIAEEINKTNDPKKRQDLIEYYNEQSELVNKSKNAIIEQFNEASKAGIVTADSIKLMAKELNITEKEARTMTLTTVMQDAATKSELTKEEVSELAKKYGVADSEAQKLLETIKSQAEKSEEVGNSVDELAKKYSEENQKLSGDYEKHKNALAEIEALRASGETLTVTQLELEKESQKAIDEIAKKMQERDKIDQEMAEKYPNSYKKKTAATKESNKEKKTEYELAKKNLDMLTAQREAVIENALAETELATLKTGRELSALETNLAEIQSLKEYNRILIDNKARYEELITVTQKTKDTDKRAEQLKEINDELSKIDKALLDNHVKELKITTKVNADTKQATAEAEALQREFDRNILEIDIEAGIKNASELTLFDIGDIDRQINELNDKLSNAELLGLSDGEIIKLKSQLTKFNNERYSLEVELNEKLQYERIESIKDLSERQKELELYEARKTYQEKVTLAKGNYALELEAFKEFQRRKEEIQAGYLARNSAWYSSVSTLMKGMSELKIEYNEPDTASLEAQKKQIEDEKELLYQSLQEREITVEEYYQKLEELQEQHNGVSEQLNKSSADRLNQIWQQAKEQIAKTLTDITASYQEKFKLNADNIIAITNNRASLELEREKILQQNQQALRDGNKEQYEATFSRMIELDKEQTEQSIALADEKSAAYENFALSAGSMFVSLIAQGESFHKAFAKTTLEALKQIIPIYIAEATAKAFATNPIAGIVIAGIATTAIYAALSGAQAAFWTGGKVSGRNRHILVNELGEEYVMNHRATAKNITAFDRINRENLSVEEYVSKYRRDTINEIGKEPVTREEKLLLIESLKTDNLVSKLSEQNSILVEENRKMQALMLENIETTKSLKHQIETRVKVGVVGELKADGDTLSASLRHTELQNLYRG